MGKMSNNNVMASARGKVGYVVFKKVNGRMVAANLPDRDPARAKTNGQKAQAKRFKRASRYADAVGEDAVLKAPYAEAAVRKGRSARALAMGDYFNKPEINRVDTSLYKGEPGNIIAIDAEDDFLVKGITVVILSNGVEVERGAAVEDRIKLIWNYTATAAAVPGTISIRVSAFDTPGNVVTVEQTV